MYGHLIKKKRKRKKQRSLVADRGETVENKDCRDGDPRGAAEDKSVERGHATDRGIAPIALGARGGRGCKRSGGRVSEQFLKKEKKKRKKKEKKKEEKTIRRRRREEGGDTLFSRVLQIIFINHHHYRVSLTMSSLF